MAEFAHIDALARTPGEHGAAAVLARPGLRVAAVSKLVLANVMLHPGSSRKRPAVVLRRAVADVLGTRLPSRPNTTAGVLPYAVWLAPQRWLLAGAGDSNLVSSLSMAMAGIDAAAVAASVSDVSDAALVLDITGHRAETLMAMACSLDLAAPGMRAGHAARSLFAGQHALLYRRDDGFRVHVDATLAVYTLAWCRQAAQLLEA